MAAPKFSTQRFDQADAALAYVTQLYDTNIAYLRDSLQRFVAGENFRHPVRAKYPFVRVHTETVARADSRLSYGFVAGPGTYETTLTRPDLYADYYRDQFQLLLANHGVALEIGLGGEPIPVHFSLDEHQHLEGQLTPERRMLLPDFFDLPDLARMDDGIANGTYETRGGSRPLALFTAPRVDYSLHRPPDPATPRDDAACIAFGERGNVVTRRVGRAAEPLDAQGAVPPRLPQMPAYHLIRKDRTGVTMVN